MSRSACTPPGKIPGSFFKREGRSGEKGTLVARMIDRPLRPLFPKGWHRETQLVSIPLSIDHVVPYDILAMNGASAALMVSNIPFPQPVGAVRIGKIDGNFVVNPNEEDLLTADLDLVVSGTDEAILMVEAGANEIPEAEILDALDIAHSEIKKLVAAMRELGEKAGKAPSSRSRRRRSTRACSSRSRARTGRSSTRPPRSRTSSPARTPRRPSRRRSSRSTPAPRTPRVRRGARQGAARVRQAREVDHPRAHRDPEEAPGRPRHRRDPRRSRSRPACSRARTAPRCSRAARRRRCPSPPSAPRVRRCGSTRSGWRPPSATSTTTTSRPSRSGRPASCAARSAATSATARSPSGRSSR